MNTPILSHSKKRRNAFTLIEIMVATVIMIILTGLVIQITSQVLNVWNRSSGKLAANAEARIAMDLLTQDLETAVFRNNGMRWLEARQENLSGPVGGSFQTTELKLFSPALDRPAGAGDICGIAYLLEYRNPITGTTVGDRTFILYRHLVAPDVTFDNLMGAGNQETFNVPAEWQDSAIRDDGKNYLVSNIVDFRVDFYVEGPGNTSLKVTNVNGVLFGGTGATVGPGALPPAAPLFAKPLSYAVITLKVISDEAMELLSSGNLAQTGLSADEYVTANSEVFTRRVNFLARPL
jgi:type II secretory pathway pseudopilin PulG